MKVTLQQCHARELAWQLDLLEDWLSHGGPTLRHDLARFGYYDQSNPDLAVQHLINQLRHASRTLRQQLIDIELAGGRR